jgi:phosphate/sulfate permease
MDAYYDCRNYGGWWLIEFEKVAQTMSKKITYMNPGQGFTSNLITAILVWTASASGLPVSTTHVSVGGIFGIGVVNKKADYKMIWKNCRILGINITYSCNIIRNYIFHYIKHYLKQ